MFSNKTLDLRAYENSHNVLHSYPNSHALLVTDR